jgi:hypothetical protein
MKWEEGRRGRREQASKKEEEGRRRKKEEGRRKKKEEGRRNMEETVHTVAGVFSTFFGTEDEPGEEEEEDGESVFLGEEEEEVVASGGDFAGFLEDAGGFGEEGGEATLFPFSLSFSPFPSFNFAL